MSLAGHRPPAEDHAFGLPVGKALLGGQRQHLVRPGLGSRAVAAKVTHEKGEGQGNRAAERVPHVPGQRHRGRAARLGLVGVAQQPQDNVR